MTFCENRVKGNALFCLAFNIYFYLAFLQEKSYSWLACSPLLC